jgi:hypothetical protein
MIINRVRIRMFKIAPQIKKTGLHGSTIVFQTSLESFDVESTNNRFVALSNSVHPCEWWIMQ